MLKTLNVLQKVLNPLDDFCCVEQGHWGLPTSPRAEITEETESQVLTLWAP